MGRHSTRLLRHRVLGEESLYRVVSEREGLVELEVVRAPRLEPGRRFHLTAEAVRGMDVVDEDAVASAEVDGTDLTRGDEPFPRWAAAVKDRLRS
jgi:hypothetical protein